MVAYLIALLVVLIIIVIGWYVWKHRRPSPPHGSCTKTGDCPPGNTCLNGKCVAGGCGSKNPCPKGQVCQNGACVGTQCEENDNCFVGQICVGETCVGGCRFDTECPSGSKCVDGVCVAAPCKKNDDCPPGQICQGGTCVSGGCRFKVDCPKGQVCKNHACVGGGCLENSDCPKGQICKGGTCIGGCGSNSDCPAGQSCIRGSCHPTTSCKTTANCPDVDICFKGACITAPKCSTPKAPAALTTYLIRNLSVNPTYAIGMTWTGNDYVMYEYSPSVGELQKLLQEVEVSPGPTAGQFFIHTTKGLPFVGYVVRDLKSNVLTIAKATPGKYDPAKDPNALWAFEGGLLSDPGKNVVVGAAMCNSADPPPTCVTTPGSATHAGPYLTSYDPYDCQAEKYSWTFDPPPA